MAIRAKGLTPDLPTFMLVKSSGAPIQAVPYVVSRPPWTAW